MAKKAVSVIHIPIHPSFCVCPYLLFFFHLNRSFVFAVDFFISNLVFSLCEITEFLFTLIIGLIFFSFKDLKL